MTQLQETSNTLLGNLHIGTIKLNANESSSQFERGQARGPASKEWIDYNTIRRTSGLNGRGAECLGKSRKV